MDTVLCHWNHIWLQKYQISTKEFEKKIRLCCTRFSKWSHKNINLSGHIPALVPWLLHKDWIRSDPFLPKRNKTFHPAVEVILQGKSPQAIIRYICWMYLSGYNLLKESVTGHLLWRCSGEKCVSRCIVCESVLTKKCWIIEVWKFGADVSKYDTLTFYTPFSSALKIIFAQLRNQSDSHHPSPDKISASTKRWATKHYPWSVTAVLIFHSSLSQSRFPHHTIAYNLKLRGQWLKLFPCSKIQNK